MGAATPTSARAQEWARVYPPVAETFEHSAPVNIDPLSYFSRQTTFAPRQYVAHRLDDGKGRVVLDAPDDAGPGSSQLRNDVLWQSNHQSVVIGGTHLPAPAGTASHIIEYWPESRRWEVVARLNGRLGGLHAMDGDSRRFVAIDDGERRAFVRGPERWEEREPSDDARHSWKLRVAEAWNEPPDVIAVGPQGQTVRMTHFNRQYDASTWGSVRAYDWQDAKGRQWKGGLMVPNDHDPKVRHPLVIQTYGFVPDRFYLDGSNWSDGYTSGFAGRAFLRENILVLALPWGPTTGEPIRRERDSIAAFLDGVESAIAKLVADGLADRERIGIMGWSATGERVHKLVTFSPAPIRAASILDGDAGTLFERIIGYGWNQGIMQLRYDANDGKPYGDSVARWIRNDPSLSSHCIDAALRIESYRPVVSGHWDTYALLREQYKPVEMIRMPKGAHGLSRPSERMISLQGNVDWYRFWLKDEERTQVVIPGETEASLREQYVRWRQMPELKNADDARSRCEKRGLP